MPLSFAASACSFAAAACFCAGKVQCSHLCRSARSLSSFFSSRSPSPWLKSQRLALDFKSKTVEIGRSRTDESKEGQIVVDARKRHGQLTIVDADLGSSRISAMIDTGSEITICNDALRALVDAKTNTYERRQMIGLETLAGESFRGQMIYLPFLRLGGLQLGAVPAAHVNMHTFKLWDLDNRPALVLGMDLLRQFSCVTLDFGRSTVRFDI